MEYTEWKHPCGFAWVEKLYVEIAHVTSCEYENNLKTNFIVFVLFFAVLKYIACLWIALEFSISVVWLLGGSMVRVLDSGPRGREFDSRPVRYQVTTMGKLFTPACLCRCTWSSGWCRLVTFRLRFDSHCGSFASNLEQVDNLRRAQVNSASYPQRDGK